MLDVLDSGMGSKEDTVAYTVSEVASGIADVGSVLAADMTMGHKTGLDAEILMLHSTKTYNQV
jgi:hypothetical protein